MEWKVDKSFLHTSFKGFCVGRKHTLKISIARIPFLCCLYAAMKYFRLQQRRECRNGENSLFSSHVQVPAASLSYLQASNIHMILQCSCWLASMRRQHNTYTQNVCIKTWYISTSFTSPSPLLASGVLVSGTKATGSSRHWATNTPLAGERTVSIHSFSCRTKNCTV